MKIVRQRYLMVVSVVILATISGCTLVDSGEEESESTQSQVVAQLSKAANCDALLESIQNDVIAKIELAAKEMRFPDWDNGGVYKTTGSGPMIGVEEVMDAPNMMPGSAQADFSGAAGTSGAAPATQPTDAIPPSADPINADTGSRDQGSSSLDDNDSGSDGETVSSPTGHSETNVQVEGVDEPDIVKTDEEGRRIYLLHGRELFVINAWAPASTDVQGRLAIEGYPREMFIWKDRAVIFSEVMDEDGTLSGKTATNNASAEYDEYYYDGYYSGEPFTKITLVNVEEDTRPEEVREIFIKGSYLTARLHETIARVVIQGGFVPPRMNANIEYYDIWGEKLDQAKIDEQIKFWRSNMIEQIRDTELSDWLPTEVELVQGKLEPIAPRCENYYAPSPGLTAYGMTNIVAMDLTDDSSDFGGATILGEAAEVYSSEKMILLAHNDWSWLQRGVDYERTALHRFDLSSTMDTKYVASGFVQGHIKDQFSMDERSGIIRIATELWSWRGGFVGFDLLDADGDGDASDKAPAEEPPQIPDNRVITLAVDKQKLVQIGSTDPLGHDGEDIRSVRFVGDYGYVVTFRQIDPLIIVDLSNPKADPLPVLGELEINGFSEYMHPMGENHLLTIGRNATTTGRDTGLMLRIFDVEDPTSPESVWEYPYLYQGESIAASEHKAFNYYADRDLLAFPFVSYGSNFGSSLEVFRVTIENGFEWLGSIDHTGLVTSSCPTIYAGMYIDSYWIRYECRRPAPEVRRGIFISGEVDGQQSDFIYSISYGGVLVHNLNDLTAPVAEVLLPEVDPYEYPLYTDGMVVGPVRIGGSSVDFAVNDDDGFAVDTEPTIIPVPPPDDALPPEMAVCGDGIIEGDEQCDGADLGGATCESLSAGMETGELLCSANCIYDTSQCVDVEQI